MSLRIEKSVQKNIITYFQALLIHFFWVNNIKTIEWGNKFRTTHCKWNWDREFTPKSTKLSTWSPSSKWPSKWSRQISLRRCPNFKKVPSMKSTPWQSWSTVPTSSDISICSRQLTISISFMNTATGAHLKKFWKKTVLLEKSRAWSILDSLPTPSKFLHKKTLCTEILNHRTSSSIMGFWK